MQATSEPTPVRVLSDAALRGRRAKYQQAFREGARVMVHTQEGPTEHRVRRLPDGSFEWAHENAAVVPSSEAG